MATYINNNVKFHGFSKSPVSPDTTLGGAVNPSGHTITTSQVRAQDIPAFLNTFQGTKDTAITWLGKNYATPAHNDIAYYGGEFKAGFDTPKCLKYNGKTSTWEDFDLKYTDRQNKVLRTTLKNADDKDVLAIHQDCSTVFVDGGNNAATNSNRWSLFVKKADGSILDHFVASTDKIVAGMPSLGYNALVLWNGGAIDEGELDANYIGNTFAGIVHLNKQYSTGDDSKFKVTCFEYIGDKLDTALDDIDGKIQDIVDTTMEGVVASVGTTTTAKNAGISVDSTTKTSPKIDISTGTVGGASDAKLVTGSTVKTYVDSATAKATVSAQGVVTTGDEAKLVTATGAQNIATKAASDEISAATLADGEKIATATDTSKLVTVEDVTTYVSENAKVTLTQGTGITVTPNEQASTSFTIAVDDTVATKQSVDDLSDVVSGVSQTVADIQTSLSTGSIAAAIQNAQDAADDAQTTANEALGLAETAIQKVKVNGTELTKSGTEVDITAIVDVDATVANGINVTKTSDNKVKIGVTPATYTSSNKTWTNESNVAKASDVKAAITDAVNGITIPTLSTTSTGVGLSASGHTVNVATADYTPASASWTNQSYLITGATVEAFVDAETTKTLEAAKAYSDSLHTTSLDYVVLGDSESLPTASAATLGKIYLVKEGNTANGETNIDAISGSYVEYMTRKVSETEYTWEKIGTTAADLSAYAKDADVIKSVTLNGEKVQVSNNNAKIDAFTKVSSAGYVGTTTYGFSAGSINVIPSYYNFGASDNFIQTGLNGTYISAAGDRLYIANGFITGGSPNVSGYKSLACASIYDGSVASELKNDIYEVCGNTVYNSKGFVIDEIKGSAFLSGRSVFASCTNLVSWTCDLPNIRDGSNMFQTCSALETFIGDLSSLIYGQNMFKMCISLETYIGDLRNLQYGFDMFKQTNLSLESIEEICESLPNRTGLTNSGEVGTITISWYDTNKFNDEQFVKSVSELFVKLATEKNWTIDTNPEIGSMNGNSFVPAVTATDGTTQYYIYAHKVEVTDQNDDNYDCVSSDGKKWKVFDSKCLIGQIPTGWELFTSREEAISTWGLTEVTK